MSSLVPTSGIYTYSTSDKMDSSEQKKNTNALCAYQKLSAAINSVQCVLAGRHGEVNGLHGALTEYLYSYNSRCSGEEYTGAPDHKLIKMKHDVHKYK